VSGTAKEPKALVVSNMVSPLEVVVSIGVVFSPGLARAGAVTHRQPGQTMRTNPCLSLG
jgi:hypothetical protein